VKFYWHIHHRELIELANEPIRNRVKFIKEFKPKDQVETRLRLLRPVKNQKLAGMLIQQIQANRYSYPSFYSSPEYDKLRAWYQPKHDKLEKEHPEVKGEESIRGTYSYLVHWLNKKLYFPDRETREQYFEGVRRLCAERDLLIQVHEQERRRIFADLSAEYDKRIKRAELKWEKSQKSKIQPTIKRLEKAKADLEALHKKECKKCPWDGETIFPGNSY